MNYTIEPILKMVYDILNNKGNYKTYCGYRVCAIDGMRINLPNTDELLKNYGSQPYSQGTVQAQALVSCLYDVMNEVVLDTSLNPYNSNERTLAYTMKNRLMLEKFSGVSEQCILQDFYANVFLVNLLAYVRTDTQSDVDTINNSKKLKHQYQLNISATIEALRPNVIKLFVVQNHRKQRKLLNQIYYSLLNCLCPIRPDRSFPRKHRHPSIKFPQNRKLF